MKILFVGIQDIFGEIDAGGVQVSRRNYELLWDMTDEIHAAIFCEEGNVRARDNHICYFSRACSNMEAVKSAFLLRRIYKLKEEKRLLKYIETVNPDVVFLDCSAIGIILKKLPAHIKTIVFFHNIETDFSWNKVKKEGACFLPAFFASYYNERVATRIATKVITLNERDDRRLNQLFGRTSDMHLGVSFDDYFQYEKLQRNEQKKELLFIGSLFGPNYQGILWFVDEVMGVLPEYHLSIVGKNFEYKKRELERDNVTVIGTVDDLEKYYYSYSVVVMPIQYGAGMKVKTAEAMMYGMTILGTDEAFEGYQVDGIRGIYRCNTADEFVNVIHNIYENGLLKDYEEDVREVFIRDHETKHLREKIRLLIEKI